MVAPSLFQPLPIQSRRGSRFCPRIDLAEIDDRYRAAITDDPLAVLAQLLRDQHLDVLFSQWALAFQFLENDPQCLRLELMNFLTL